MLTVNVQTQAIPIATKPMPVLKRQFLGVAHQPPAGDQTLGTWYQPPPPILFGFLGLDNEPFSLFCVYLVL